MASRLIPGVPPHYPAREELNAEEASRQLEAVVGKFFDDAERLNVGREEFERRYQAELGAWANVERDRLGLDAMTIPPMPPGLTTRIEKRVRTAVLAETGIENFDAAPRMQIRAAAGLGKTSVVINEMVKREFWHNRHVHFYVPTTELAKELAPKFPSDGPSVRIMRGRASGAPHHPMCAKYRAAKRAAQLGLSVFRTLCHRRDRSGQEIVCPHYSACPYIKQWQDRSPGVRIFAHAYLPLPRPRPDGHSLPEPDLVIVDESALGKLSDTTAFAHDRLKGAALDAVRTVLDDGIDFRDALRNRDVTAQMARKTADRLIQDIETHVRPNMPEREALDLLDEASGSEAHKLAQFWFRVAAEIDLDRPFHGIEVCKDEKVRVDGALERQDRVHVHWPRKPVIGKTTALLMIDADADLEINRHFFGHELQSVEIQAKRNAYVIQCLSTRLSRQALLGNKPKQAPKGSSALRKVRQIIKKGAERGGGRVLVIMPKLIRTFLTGKYDEQDGWSKEKLPRSEMWQGVEIAHFGYIRGSDKWAGCATVITVGREQPSLIDIERRARAIWADDPEPLIFVGEGRLPEEPRGYRLRDGSHKGVKTPIHPDPRCQRLIELIRENEIVQAIDRARLVHAAIPKLVIILCSIPLDITIDELRTLDELAGTPERLGWRARLERVIEDFGMLPLGQRDLYQAFHDYPVSGDHGPYLIPSESYARYALKEVRRSVRNNAAKNGGTNQYGYLIGLYPHFRIAHYRRAGQPGHRSRVMYDPSRHSNPREFLSRLLREPINSFDEVPFDGAKRERIIWAVHCCRREIESGDILLCDIAEFLDTSPSYVSIVKNSLWGLRRLRQLEEIDFRGSDANG